MNPLRFPLNRSLTFILILALAIGLMFSPLIVSGQAAASDGTPTPTGLQPLTHNGGIFRCDGWTVEVPANVAPDGSLVHCGAFNPHLAPVAPNGYSLRLHTININIYDNKGEWIKNFDPPLKFCYTFSDADLAAAGNDARRFTVASAPIDGLWSVILSAITPDTRQVCANTDHLTLFDLALSGAASTSGAAAATATAASGAVVYEYVTFNYGYTYTVQPGDNLFRIALKFRTSIAAIQAANGLGSNLIYVGQVLLIPTNVRYAATTATATVSGSATPRPTGTPAPSAGATSAPKQTIYVVQAGDNLFRIALKFNTTIAAIQQANGLPGTNILVGQRLIIPGK